jgi:signal transduction histidine kinase
VHREADGSISFAYVPLDRTAATAPIGAILQDVTGKLWISSTSGISRLDPVSLAVHPYTARDGLIDGSFFIGSAQRMRDGRLVFGGARGISVVRHERISYNPIPPPVAITDILVHNRSIFEPSHDGEPSLPRSLKEFSVPYDQSSVVFEFAALHFADPARNRFAYQLVGFDSEWIYADPPKHYAAYTNLDPGRYQFRARAANKDGVWNDIGASVVLHITPPFWMTAWFRGGAVLLLFALVALAYRLRVRFLVEQRNRLTDLVAKRTHELQIEKEAVEIAHGNISRLSEIGREITAELDDETIMGKVYRHVERLMDAEAFGIGFVRAAEGVIEFPYAIEHGRRYAPYSRPLSDVNQLAVWCVKNQREILIGDVASEYMRYVPTWISGEEEGGPIGVEAPPLEPHSLIYVPIISANQLHGVLNVQSSRYNAYQGIHVDMLRTLAAYLAVALDNAQAYEDLQQAQEQLVAHQKLAALGSLVAGVAHELNTPLGNGLVAASTVEERTGAIRTMVESSTARRSDLKRYFDDTEAAMRMTLRALTRAADIVAGFKQLAIDRRNEVRTKFFLRELVETSLRPLLETARASGCVFEIAVPAEIQCNTYAVPLGDVLSNLAHNALTHAFSDRAGGTIRVTAQLAAGAHVLLRFADDGCGIGAEHLSKIFDPFFTTRLGQGRSGLGLNITYNIVTSLLGGTIRAESVPGQGTTFILELPLDPGPAGES